MAGLISHPPAATGGGALLSSSHRCSLQIANPIHPLFTKRQSRFCISRGLKPLTLAKSVDDSSGGGGGATKPNSDSSNTIPFGEEKSKPIAFVSQESVPLEGVIQFEKPDSSSLIAKWGFVALLAGGDVAALLLFSAIGRFSHGFSVFELGTFQTADPFIAGWLLSAYLLGGYGDDGKGKNGLNAAVVVAAKSWSVGIPLGLFIRAVTIGHIPPTKFILVTMGSTAVLLIGWRALLYSVMPSNKSKKNDVYKRGSPFELFELLTSLIRRW